MRKYWKFIAIITVIVLSIGTFYVKSATSAKQNPGFVIQTLSGDENEIKPLVLDGSYVDTTSNYMSTNIKIDAEGSTYNSPSFLEQLIGREQIEIKELQKKYRTFMRGKGSQIDSFFESNQFLAYADVDYKVGSIGSGDFEFHISVLNKESGDVESFIVDVPESENFQYAFMEDVQMVKDELHLITHTTLRKNNEYLEEKYIYTIDLANQKISNFDAVIKNSNGKDDTYFNNRLILQSPATKASEHIVIVNTEVKLIEDEESSREEVINQEFLSYNTVTQEIKKMDLADLQLDENQLSTLDGSTVYFMTFEGKELVVTPYSLIDDQVKQEYRIPLSGENGIAYAYMTIVKDGKLYVASSQMTRKINADVIVADAATGETLYKGQLALEDSSEAKGDYELYLHEILVK